MKKKRITSKILVVIVCLSIVLTLFIVPCFASSGYLQGNSYELNDRYLGIPFSVGSFYDSGGEYFGSYIEDSAAVKVNADGRPYLINSVINLNKYVGSFNSTYNNSHGIYYSLSLPVEGAYVDADGRPYIGGTWPLVDAAVDYLFTANSWVGVATSDYSSIQDYYVTFNNANEYTPFFGSHNLKLSYNDVLAIDWLNYSSYVFEDFYVYTFDDFIAHYTIYYDFDVYYRDSTDDYRLNTRHVSSSVEITNPNLYVVDSSFVSDDEILNMCQVLYNDADVRLRYCSVDLIGNLINLIENNSGGTDIGYITNLNIGIMSTDFYTGNNPYLADAAAENYGYLPISGCRFSGEMLIGDIVNESKSTFIDDATYTYQSIENVKLDDFDLVSWLGDTLGGIMDVEIIGSITLGSVLYVAMGAGFIFLILRFFAGG